jgi:hypothetical protein
MAGWKGSAFWILRLAIFIGFGLVAVFYGSKGVAAENRVDSAVFLLMALLAACFSFAQIWPRRLALLMTGALSIMVAVWAFEAWAPVPPEERMADELVTAATRLEDTTGQTVRIQYLPGNFGAGSLRLASGENVMPLGTVTGATVVMCREGPRPFATYKPDKYGFNNPDTAWINPEIAFLGDSFVYGQCINQQDHFVEKIRAKHPGTINLGQGGNGPPMMLAGLREYLLPVRPRIVFWMYDENNDLYQSAAWLPSDIVREMENPILARYVNDPSFIQHLPEHQAQINDAINAIDDDWLQNSRYRASLRSRLQTLERTRNRLRTSWEQMFAHPAAAATPATVAPPVTATKEQQELFKKILAEAIAEVRSYGGRFVFVNIPAQETICYGRDIAIRHDVIDSARALGADIIDLESDFRLTAADRGTAVVTADGGCGGHFSEIGYDVIYKRLDQYLQFRSQPNGLVDGWQHDEGDDQWVFTGRPYTGGIPPVCGKHSVPSVGLCNARQ